MSSLRTRLTGLDVPAGPQYEALHSWQRSLLHSRVRISAIALLPFEILTSFIAWFCYKNYIHRVLSSQTLVKLPQRVIDVVLSKYSYAFGGFVSALSLFVEEKRRRGELAMYVLPKSLESAWLTARGKGWLFQTGHFGEMLVSG